MFESQPKQSGANAKSGVEGGGSDSEYTTSDDEPEYKKVISDGSGADYKNVML